ncbi:MAG: nitrogen regulation protein NR(II), partial [Acidobacteriota bacterium]
AVRQQLTLDLPVHRFRLPGGQDHYLHLRLSPYTEDDGPGGTIIIIDDVTEQVEMERQLAVSRKLAAATRILSDVAHKIKNPLTSIAMNLRVLRDHVHSRTGAPDDLSRLVEAADHEINDLNHMIRQFLSSVRPDSLHLEPCDAEEIVEDILALLRHDMKSRNIDVATHFSGHPPAVLADRNHLREALLNIILNAIEAMPQGGRLAISTGPDGQDGMAIRVDDTGCGISKEDLEKVFDLYFTTKPDGAGLGLSTAFLIVEQLGGRIDIQSEVQRGTSVTITLKED